VGAGAGGPQERGLVDPDRAHPGQPVRVLDQRGAVVNDLGHDRVPGHAELGRDPVVVSDLLERPLPGPVGQHRPRGDRVVLLGPGLLLAQPVSSLDNPLAPTENDPAQLQSEEPLICCIGRMSHPVPA